MFKRNEKKTARWSTVAGLVYHGAIATVTQGNAQANEFDGQLQKRIQLGLSAD